MKFSRSEGRLAGDAGTRMRRRSPCQEKSPWEEILSVRRNSGWEDICFGSSSKRAGNLIQGGNIGKRNSDEGVSTPDLGGNNHSQGNQLGEDLTEARRFS